MFAEEEPQTQVTSVRPVEVETQTISSKSQQQKSSTAIDVIFNSLSTISDLQNCDDTNKKSQQQKSSTAIDVIFNSLSTISDLQNSDQTNKKSQHQKSSIAIAVVDCMISDLQDSDETNKKVDSAKCSRPIDLMLVNSRWDKPSESILWAELNTRSNRYGPPIATSHIQNKNTKRPVQCDVLQGSQSKVSITIDAIQVSLSQEDFQEVESVAMDSSEQLVITNPTDSPIWEHSSGTYDDFCEKEKSHEDKKISKAPESPETIDFDASLIKSPVDLSLSHIDKRPEILPPDYPASIDIFFDAPLHPLPAFTVQSAWRSPVESPKRESLSCSRHSKCSVGLSNKELSQSANKQSINCDEVRLRVSLSQSSPDEREVICEFPRSDASFVQELLSSPLEYLCSRALTPPEDLIVEQHKTPTLVSSILALPPDETLNVPLNELNCAIPNILTVDGVPPHDSSGAELLPYSTMPNSPSESIDVISPTPTSIIMPRAYSPSKSDDVISPTPTSIIKSRAGRFKTVLVARVNSPIAVAPSVEHHPCPVNSSAEEDVMCQRWQSPNKMLNPKTTSVLQDSSSIYQKGLPLVVTANVGVTNDTICQPQQSPVNMQSPKNEPVLQENASSSLRGPLLESEEPVPLQKGSRRKKANSRKIKEHTNFTLEEQGSNHASAKQDVIIAEDRRVTRSMLLGQSADIRNRKRGTTNESRRGDFVDVKSTGTSFSSKEDEESSTESCCEPSSSKQKKVGVHSRPQKRGKFEKRDNGGRRGVPATAPPPPRPLGKNTKAGVNQLRPRISAGRPTLPPTPLQETGRINRKLATQMLHNNLLSGSNTEDSIDGVRRKSTSLNLNQKVSYSYRKQVYAEAKKRKRNISVVESDEEIINRLLRFGRSSSRAKTGYRRQLDQSSNSSVEMFKEKKPRNICTKPSARTRGRHQMQQSSRWQQRSPRTYFNEMKHTYNHPFNSLRTSHSGFVQPDFKTPNVDTQKLDNASPNNVQQYDEYGYDDAASANEFVGSCAAKPVATRGGPSKLFASNGWDMPLEHSMVSAKERLSNSGGIVVDGENPSMEYPAVEPTNENGETESNVIEGAWKRHCHIINKLSTKLFRHSTKRVIELTTMINGANQQSQKVPSDEEVQQQILKVFRQLETRHRKMMSYHFKFAKMTRMFL